LAKMIHDWQVITAANDPWLDSLEEKDMTRLVVKEGITSDELWGTVLLRMTYHYWYHLGENAGIRQILGHTNLPQFVGDIDNLAPYRS